MCRRASLLLVTLRHAQRERARNGPCVRGRMLPAREPRTRHAPSGSASRWPSRPKPPWMNSAVWNSENLPFDRYRPTTALDGGPSWLLNRRGKRNQISNAQFHRKIQIVLNSPLQILTAVRHPARCGIQEMMTCFARSLPSDSD